MINKIKEFHKKFGILVQDTPSLPFHLGIRSLRIALLREEFEEYVNAEKADDLIEIADALADIIYVAYGTAIAYGIPIDRILDEVHRSNMTKTPSNDPSKKILKGPNYEPPRIKEVLFE